MNTFLHVHLQAKFSAKQKQRTAETNNFSKQKLELLLKGLLSFVQKITVRNVKTTWDNYYTYTILGDDYLRAKTGMVKSFSNFIDFKTVIDLGANDGHFSLLFSDNKEVIAMDSDSNCINQLYLKIKNEGISNILPLVNDLTVPSPAIGWANEERESITSRLNADLVLALALVHHLAIANNVPLHLIAAWLQPMGEHLMIEFVPKDDEKVIQLLQHRADIFEDYNLEKFRSIFTEKYTIVKEEKVSNTNRILFLMKRK